MRGAGGWKLDDGVKVLDDRGCFESLSMTVWEGSGFRVLDDGCWKLEEGLGRIKRKEKREKKKETREKMMEVPYTFLDTIPSSV